MDSSKKDRPPVDLQMAYVIFRRIPELLDTYINQILENLPSRQCM